MVQLVRNAALIASIFLLLLLAGEDAEAQCPLSCPTADDVAIQQLLDAAAAAGGGVVQLEPRVYLVCEPLVVGPNTHLRGAGRGATIIRGSAILTTKIVNNSFVSASISTVSNANVTISNLTVDHASCVRNANGIAFLPSGLSPGNSEAYDGPPCTNGIVENVEVLGSPEFHSYMIWNLRGHHIKIVNNWVDGGASAESFQEGIESFGGHDVLISGNTVKNIGYACLNVGSAGLQDSGTVAVSLVNNYLSNCTVGVHLGTSMDGADPLSQRHTRVIGNVITGVRKVGIDVAVVAGTVESDLTIAHNTIRDISTSGAIGIFLRTSGGSTLGSEAVVSNTISENHIENIRGSNAHGIRLTNYHNVRIIGNTITDTDHAGVFALGSRDLEIIGNRMERAGITAVQLWGNSSSTIERFVVERNLIGDWLGLSSGILVVTAKFGTVKDNVFKRADLMKTSPIGVAYSCGVTITGNVPWYYPSWSAPAIPPCP